MSMSGEGSMTKGELERLIEDKKLIDWLQGWYCGQRWNGTSLGEDFLDLMTYHEGGHMLHNDIRQAIKSKMERDG